MVLRPEVLILFQVQIAHYIGHQIRPFIGNSPCPARCLTPKGCNADGIGHKLNLPEDNSSVSAPTF